MDVRIILEEVCEPLSETQTFNTLAAELASVSSQKAKPLDDIIVNSYR
jgi:hypothetical protein